VGEFGSRHKAWFGFLSLCGNHGENMHIDEFNRLPEAYIIMAYLGVELTTIRLEGKNCGSGVVAAILMLLNTQRTKSICSTPKAMCNVFLTG
jgi:hypothetical protein